MWALTILLFIVGAVLDARERASLSSAMIGGVLIGLVIVIIYGGLRRQFGDASARAASDVRRQSPEHLRRLEQWDQAYYCRKHDAVILGVGTVLSPTEFRRLMTDET